VRPADDPAARVGIAWVGKDHRVIDILPRVVAADPDKPVRPEARATQRRSREIAEALAIWSAAMAAETVSRYAELATSWNDERGTYRPVPLRDALDRGGPWPPGRCLEVGAGTGLLTPEITALWPQVVSLDLSPEMLARSRSEWRVRADASRLPIPDRCAAAVVLADVPLFADEVIRVLDDAGVVIWSNALGEDAPHHVPVDVIFDALRKASPDTPWTAVSSEAGWGLWAVFRRPG
jgi:SAM-dependent methyltransferase